MGYGSTEYSRKSEEPLLWYYSEAIRRALEQTGLKKDEIQGLSITTQACPDYSPYVAEQLGLELDWVLNGDYGGAGGVMSVRRAADAIEAGHVDTVVLVGGNTFDKSVVHQRALEYQRANYVDVYAYGGPNTLMALVQRRHMEQYGTTLQQIGKIALAQRENARRNPQALLREPMTIEDYLNSRMISDPIRLLDCVMICSGADCIVLASEEKAKKITDKPVYLVTDAERVAYQVGDMVSDVTTSGIKIVADRLFRDLNERRSTASKSMTTIPSRFCSRSKISAIARRVREDNSSKLMTSRFAAISPLIPAAARFRSDKRD